MLTGGNALYTATYTYDTLDRLTSGRANEGSSYSYGDAAHLHAATSTSGGYSATYDTAGNMTCRAPTSSATCTGGSPTGAGFTYDNEGQLVTWTSALTGTPTPSRAAFAYDGEGSRVAQQTTSPTGIMTTTDYLLGGLEEQQTVGGSVHPSSSLTEYYPLPGIGTAVRVTTSSTSTLSYLASDQLGSVSVALSTSGTVTAQALYSPYGTVRYSSGTMPTAHGYTGQLADAMTGLDDYGARYYDPTLGQFTSADTVLAGGLNRYAYVGGNPETSTDPSGHALDPADAPPGTGLGIDSSDLQGGGSGGGAPLNPTAMADVLEALASADVPGVSAATGMAAGPLFVVAAVTGPFAVPVLLSVAAWHTWQASTASTSSAPPSASPGSNQWTTPDQNAIRAAENAHPAPNNGPKKPGPGTGTPPAPTGTPPATQTGGGSANGGAGVTPPTGSCGCWPGENSRDRQYFRVWRAVLGPELEDIQATGQFRNPFGNESKWFSLTKEGAVTYAQGAFKGWPQDGPYWLTSGRFPRDLVTPDMLQVVDRVVPSLTVPTDLLDQITSVSIHGYIGEEC